MNSIKCKVKSVSDYILLEYVVMNKIYSIEIPATFRNKFLKVGSELIVEIGFDLNEEQVAAFVITEQKEFDKWLETEEGQFWEEKAHQAADDGDGYYDDIIQNYYTIYRKDT